MKSVGSVQNNTVVEQVVEEVAACVAQVSDENLANAAALMEVAPRIFVAGAGRSGLCMRALGMRLMHLGKTVYVVGETTTPGIKSDDLLIVGSGSGKSAVLLKIGEQARQQGAKILLFTAVAYSPLSEIAEYRVIIPALSLKPAEVESKLMSMQPMGSLFEQSLLILCDSIVVMLMHQSGTGVGQMLVRHANLE